MLAIPYRWFLLLLGVATGVLSGCGIGLCAGGCAFSNPPTWSGTLSALAVSPNRVDLNWTDFATGETGFEIERSADGVSGWTLAATATADTVTASDTTLSAGTEYFFRVRAVNPTGASPYSNMANATTSWPATLSATNFFERVRIQSGYLIGTASSALGTIQSVRASFDGGAWVTATGTTSWIIRLPNKGTDNVVWKTHSLHTAQIQVLDAAGTPMSDETFQLRKGLNQDSNGDGYPDLAVGAPFSSLSGTQRGRAYVFHGSATGIPAAPNRTIASPSTLNDSFFGLRGNMVGDLNGDGYADAAFGASGYYVGSYVGAVYIHYGSATGIPLTASVTITDPGTSNFGADVEGAGDVNGDGYDDLIVGASGYNADEGRAYVYHGSATGVTGPATQTLDAPGTAATEFGWAIAMIGDANGDGYADVGIGAWTHSASRGRAHIFYGSSTGLAGSPNVDLIKTGAAAAENFGIGVAGGDINGDGFDDFVVGSSGSLDGGGAYGATYVYYGSSTGIDTTIDDSVIYPYVETATGYGVGVDTGDFNKDGFDDLLVGAHTSDRDGPDQGAAFIYHGSTTGVPATANQEFLYPGADDGAELGTTVRASDFNADGYQDFAVGAAYSEIGGPDRGVTYIYHGSASGVDTIVDRQINNPGADNLAGFGLW